MKRIEHWTHRLYPKLPCDDVLSRISVLGKKMAVQTNVKKLRMGEEPLVRKVEDNEDEENNAGDQGDTTSRYENEFPTEDAFEEIMRQAEEAMKDKPGKLEYFLSISFLIGLWFDLISAPPKPSVLTDEQRERMMRNRILAEERRKAKLEEAAKKKAEEEERPFLHLSDDDDDGEINFITSKTEETKVAEEEPMSQEY